jgi:hypothetical protein
VDEIWSGFFARLAEAIAPHRGPIRLHPDNPRYFLWRGKPTVLITSGEHYGAVMNLDFDYVRYLDEFSIFHLRPNTRTAPRCPCRRARLAAAVRNSADSFGFSRSSAMDSTLFA